MITDHLTDEDLLSAWAAGKAFTDFENLRQMLENLPEPPPQPARLLPITSAPLKDDDTPDVVEGTVRVYFKWHAGQLEWQMRKYSDTTHYIDLQLPAVEDEERKDFEAFLYRNGLNGIRCTDGLTYADLETRAMWLAWQERAKGGAS